VEERWRKPAGNSGCHPERQSQSAYLLDNLVRRKLVQRTENSQDCRNKIITLTKEGHEMKDLITPLITEMYEIAGREIPNELIGSGLLLFETIYRNFEQQQK
jgi:DNA-binding MarR family transcriptional regulator